MTVLAVLLSGVLAGLLSDSGEVDFFGDTSFSRVLFSSGGGGVAIAVLVASVIAMAVRTRTFLTGLSLAAAVLAAVSALLLPSDIATLLASGVLLGCTAVQASRTRGLQAMLIASFLAGFLCAGAVEALQHPAVPRRYADYLTESDTGTTVVVPVLCVLVVVVTVWAARYPGGESPLRTVNIRTIAAVLLVPLGGLLINLLYVQSIFQSDFGFESRWYFGLFVVPVLFVTAALLPGRGGMLLLAGAAVLLTSTTTAGVGIDVSDGVWVLGLVAVIAAAVTAGAAFGLRWGRPVVGVTILAAVCATAMFDMPPLDNVHYVASLVIFPAAAVYLYVSCTPAGPVPLNPVATTLGLAVPVAIAVPMVVTYGWTAYTPLTSALHSGFSPSSHLVLSTGAAVVTVMLAGVGMVVLGRRPLADPAVDDV